MQFTDIKLFADDLIDTDDVKFPVARKVRFANRAYESVIAKIFNADGRILFDDFNFNTTPVGVAPLTSGIRSYKLKVDDAARPIVRLASVQVEDANGVYKDVKLVDIRSLEGEEVRLGTGGTGVPTKYVRMGASLIFDKTPDYTSASGQRYVFQRMVDPFIEADAAKEPGFSAQFHALIPLWMAYWEGVKRGKAQVATIRTEIAALEAELVEFYQNIDMDGETVLAGEVSDPR
jgi:hypothetical protein